MNRDPAYDTFSAVVCSHSLVNFANLAQAVDSLLAQSHLLEEIIIVVDGNREVYDRVTAIYSEKPRVKAVLLPESLGVSEARNAGWRTARGDIIAFMDDDAAASPEWIAELAETHRIHGVSAAAGRILPIWEGPGADFPEELYWLLGLTHHGFAEDKVTEVRNAFGPNMSFRREVFDRIGGFRRELGFARNGNAYVQAEEVDLGLRLKESTGRGVLYNPAAVVYHRVPEAKLKLPTVIRRSFYQGYSKALIRKLNQTGALDVEKGYLKDILLHFLPARLVKAYRPSEARKALVLAASTASVGAGFVWGSASLALRRFGGKPSPAKP
jgi:GT2 family glycosyltransferase